MTQGVLEKIKLNSVKPKNSNAGSDSDSEEDVDEFDLLENIFKVSGFQGDGRQISLASKMLYQ